MNTQSNNNIYQPCLSDEGSLVLRWLIEEQGGNGNAELPEDASTRWQLMRGLMNARPAQPVPDDVLAAQDIMLQEINARRGSIDAATLRPLSPQGENARIAVWQGDITTLQADAIVNAANSALLGCFIPGHYCIDNCIHSYAGMQLRLECARLINLQQHAEPTGMAKITPAYNLPAHHVIHTVGPIVENGAPTPEQSEELASCYTACLDAAEAADCATVAFCCISTGAFGYPAQQAADIAVHSVRSWLSDHADSAVQMVIFNVFSGDDLETYLTALQ